MTRLIAIGLAVLFIAACAAQNDAHVRARDDAFSASGKTPAATAAASARSGVSHAIVTPGTVAGAMASGRAK